MRNIYNKKVYIKKVRYLTLLLLSQILSAVHFQIKRNPVLLNIKRIIFPQRYI